MSKKPCTLRGVALAAFCCGLVAFTLTAPAEAALTKEGGAALDGSIEYVNDREVVLKTSGGEYVSALIEELSATSRDEVTRWAQAHPLRTGVYGEWDVKPSVVRSRNAKTPDQLNAPGFRGIVSLHVILDEQGKVAHAEVSKSTHTALEESALEAIRDWAFKPARVSGAAVKARIAISFKFES